jgi:competence protein ComEC
VLAGALVAGLSASLVTRFAVPVAVVLVAAGIVVRSRAAAALVLAAGGWWWGSVRLGALSHSALAARIGTAAPALLDVTEPPHPGRFAVRVRATVVRWGDASVREHVLLELPTGRAPPPQGARLRVFAFARDPGDFERTWLRRHGIRVALRASRWRIVRLHGGVADRLHAWLARASTPGLAGERRAVLQGVVLGEDSGLSDELKQRFRASGLYHLLAVRGGNVIVVAGGTIAVALLLGISRLAAEVLALAAIGAYVLAVGPQPSVIRAGVVGALASLAWLFGRERDRWYALLVAAVVLLAWNPYNALDPGFQLSFAAVLAIFTLTPRLVRVLEGYPVPRPLAQCIAVSAACGLATAPISWFHFHAIPAVTVPANAAAEPVVVPMLALALLAAVLPPLGPTLAAANGWCAVYLAGCARLFGGLPGAQIRSSAAAAALASSVLLVAAYACRRGERVEAGLSPARQRPAEDHPRRAPPA